MKENKETKISYWAAHLTTIVSVTMVLMIVGLIALVSIFAHRETERIREQIEISVIMADSISDGEASALAGYIKQQPYTLNVEVIGKQAAMDNWTQDTGVDLESLFGVNPLSPEICFTLKADYTEQSQIDKIAAGLSRRPGVEDVAVPDASMVSAMNDNIRGLTYVLGGVALVMIIISFVLINNTVRLTIYSRRFTIHTMQLVGATRNFVRRPFVLNNMLSGLLAGVFASLLLAGALALSPYIGIQNFEEYVSWPLLGATCLALIVCGVLICGVAACLATSHYLRKGYDELFK